MSIPKFKNKYTGDAIINPEDHFKAESQDYRDFVSPKMVIICFEQYIMDYYRNIENTLSQTFWTGEIIYLNKENKDIALVGNFGLGGPAAAHIFEILIAASISRFVVIGHAGGLQASLSIGTYVLVEKALRDEGLSHHYLPDSDYVYSSQNLFNALASFLNEQSYQFRTGTTWTTDSMYRETIKEIDNYRQIGISTVEMEMASLFAVATFRKVEIAGILIVSDLVNMENWAEEINTPSTKEASLKLLKDLVNHFSKDLMHS